MPDDPKSPLSPPPEGEPKPTADKPAVPGGVKAALHLMGKSLGPCRSPVGPLSAENEQKMNSVLKAAGMMG